MGSIGLSGCVYQASQDSASVLAYADTFWSHLRDRVSGLPARPPGGIGVAEAPRLALRWASCIHLGFLAVALHDAEGNSWEAFVVPHGDGGLRTGWRRRWHPDPAPPYPWKAASEHLVGLSSLPTALAPDFLLLAFALGPAANPSATSLANRLAAVFSDAQSSGRDVAGQASRPTQH